MAQLEFPIEIVDDGSGQEYQVNLASCTCIEGADVFYVYQIVGQTHFHIQCANCDQSYCPFGMCQIPAALPQDGGGG